MKKILILFIVISAFLMSSCEKNNVEKYTDAELEELYESNKDKITISQGISGTLIMKEGNCMPMVGIDNSESTCRSFPVKRKIKIYEYTLQSDVEGYAPHFDNVNSTFIVRTKSDKDGFFQFELEPGIYSIFIIEDGKYYANGSDGEGGINPLKITNDSVIIRNQRIDYAVY